MDDVQVVESRSVLCNFCFLGLFQDGEVNIIDILLWEIFVTKVFWLAVYFMYTVQLCFVTMFFYVYL